MPTTIEQFPLPDVGEGLTEAEIVSWLVAVGDHVVINQVIVEIETAKSVVELPCPFAGEVTALLAAEGDTVDVGRPIISVAVRDDADPPGPLPADPETPPASADVPADADTHADGDAVADAEGPADVDGHVDTYTDAEPRLLVGYGPPDEAPPARRRRRRGPGPSPARPAAGSAATDRPRAKPPVRELARTLHVDLASVVPTGPDGIVQRSDVLLAAEGERPTATDHASSAAVPAPDADEIRTPITGVRKHTAAAMVSSAFTAPHVTELLTVDVTATMDLRTVIAARPEFRDVRLSPLVFVARAFVRALQRTPDANARWDEAAQEIVRPRRINLGIAAATPRGLVVPNVRDAGALSLLELAVAIGALSATARDGKTPAAAMAGGTTTISNFGVFGVDAGTPILNPGETTILGLGAIRRAPWVVDDDAGERIEARWVTQLALSFDHRVIDGRQGSAVLADTGAFLRDPGLAVL